jgi:hypothetical protein
MQNRKDIQTRQPSTDVGLNDAAEFLSCFFHRTTACSAKSQKSSKKFPIHICDWAGLVQFRRQAVSYQPEVERRRRKEQSDE